MITTVYDSALIFRRELGARFHVLWVGFALAALTIILPFLPSLSTWHGGDIRDLMSVALAIGAGIALSIGCGATLFGRDLSEGRLGFYFERPVPTVAIWSGRFLAVFLLVVLCEIIILVPSGLSPYHSNSAVELLFEGLSFDTHDWILALLAGPPLLLLVSHCVSIMVRARTAWLALDVIGIALVGPAIWLIHQPLVIYKAEEAAAVVSVAIAVCVALALLSATAASVSWGRTDLRRAHRYLSITLWGVLSVALGATAAYSAWLLDIGPEDFEKYVVLNSSMDGKWVEVYGQADGHLGVRRCYLVSEDGRRMPIPLISLYGSETTFSASGNRAAWFSESAGEVARTIWHAALNETELEPVATTFKVSRNSKLFLSPEGERLVVVESEALSVYDLATERLVATLRVPESFWYPVFHFASVDRIRLLCGLAHGVYGVDKGWSARITDIDLSSGGKRTDYDLVPIPTGRSIGMDADLRFYVTGLEDRKFYGSEETTELLTPKVFDAASGEFLHAIPGSFGGFLGDGRPWSVVQHKNGDISLFILPPAGDRIIEHNLGQFAHTPTIFELPGHGMVIAYDLTNEKKDHREDPWDRLEILETESGARRPIGERLFLEGHWGRASNVTVGSHYGIPSKRYTATLFRNEDWALLRWDPDAQKMVEIMKGKRPSQEDTR
jgi:hypothetical protein